MQPVGFAHVEELLAQQRVRRHSATEAQAARSDLGRRPPSLGQQDVHHCLLERRGDVRRAHLGIARGRSRTTAVFSPLNEKSSPSPSIARGNAIAVGSPLIAMRSIAGPPG